MWRVFGGEDIREEGGQMRETDVETRVAEEIKHQRAEDNNKVMQDVLRENSRHPQEPSPCFARVSHMLEGLHKERYKGAK